MVEKILLRGAFLAVVLIGDPALSQTVGPEERVQIGTWQREELNPSTGLSIKIESVVWGQGDLRVRLTQVAPCGSQPINPDWAQAGRVIILKYRWTSPSKAASQRCKQHVQAWVFRVPERKYEVYVDDSVVGVAE